MASDTATFQNSTRLKFIRLPAMTKPTGGGTTQVDLPRAGILSQIYLQISVTTAGTLTTTSGWGIAAAIRRVRLTLNSGVDIVNITGAGYVYGLREMINLGLDPTPQNQGRVAPVTGTTYILDMIIPVSINNRDEAGLLLLQNDSTLATLVVEWETDSNVILTGGGTYTGTCTPLLGMFEVPVAKTAWPNFSIVQQIIEEQAAISGAGDYVYTWPRGNIYLGVYHTIQGSTWTQARLRIQQSIFLADFDVATHRVYFNSLVSRDTDLGTVNPIKNSNQRVFFDFLGTDGLGAYGAGRDPLDSRNVTDLTSVLTVAGAGTLSTVRRQLLTLS